MAARLQVYLCVCDVTVLRGKRKCRKRSGACASWTSPAVFQAGPLSDGIPTAKRMFRCIRAGMLCVSLLVALCICSGRAASTDGKPKIHYGDIVRFLHLETGKYLYSFPGIYTHASTSHQQAVVAIPFKDSNTHWVVVPPSGQSLENLYFKEVQPGAFRLEHHNTRRLLHSHVGHPSPVSKGQEVTCFDAVSSADINNDWFPHVTPGHGAQIPCDHFDHFLVFVCASIRIDFAVN
jgi:hypothetical protein